MQRHGKFTLFLCLILLAACANPRLSAELPDVSPAAKTSWENAVSLETPEYLVTTNSDVTVAQMIGDLMEAVYLQSSSLLGPPRNETQKLSVYAYASRKPYETRVRELGLPGSMTTGFYSPAPPSGIHLPLAGTGSSHPFFTLVHEGLHQYVQERLGYGLPGPPRTRLTPLPLWLNEGLALYLEAALVDGTHLQPGRIHPARLAHLQKLLRRGKEPAVAKVLNTTYGEPFTNADYSAAWGLTQALFDQASGLSWETFWQQWQAAMVHEVETLQAAQAGQEPIAIQQAWVNALSKQSSQIFSAHVLSANSSWEAWEAAWQAYILQLTPEP